jgi:CYTH domain-containing protein/predicted ATPase
MAKLIQRMVLTGGPCSGKTSALSILSQKLAQFGVSTIVVPEVATTVFAAGVNFEHVAADAGRLLRFQEEMVRTQIILEDRWREFASLLPGDRVLEICDRAAMDPKAYLPNAAMGEQLMARAGTSTVECIERYESVAHLVTAADGAEEHYSNATNEQRREGAEAARMLDLRTQKAWLPHPRLQVFANVERGADGRLRRIGFDEKMERLVQHAFRLVGLPAPLGSERKYLLLGPQSRGYPPALPVASHSWVIEQTYLKRRDDAERRVRIARPMEGGGILRVYTEKKRHRSDAATTTERVIRSRSELAGLLADRDPDLQTIRKLRTSFIWEGRFYQLDTFMSPKRLDVLEVTFSESAAAGEMPPFIGPWQDVTDDPEYLNVTIARG